MKMTKTARNTNHQITLFICRKKPYFKLRELWEPRELREPMEPMEPMEPI